MVTFICPKCAKSNDVSDSLLRKSVRCKGCNAQFTLLPSPIWETYYCPKCRTPNFACPSPETKTLRCSNCAQSFSTQPAVVVGRRWLTARQKMERSIWAGVGLADLLGVLYLVDRHVKKGLGPFDILILLVLVGTTTWAAYRHYANFEKSEKNHEEQSVGSESRGA